VAGLVADDGVDVVEPSSADVSFPGFFALLADLGAAVGGDP
jgi:5-enolpyruvylshikimate-3-phosphate synthase